MGTVPNEQCFHDLKVGLKPAVPKWAGHSNQFNQNPINLVSVTPSSSIFPQLLAHQLKSKLTQPSPLPCRPLLHSFLSPLKLGDAPDSVQPENQIPLPLYRLELLD